MKYDNNTETINHLSLCSGYEGIGLGLRRIFPNLREIAYVEREGFPIANLVAKMETGELDEAPVFTDVKTFPYGKFRGLVDILSGGFPCQPFSAAGKREGVEDPRHLFPYIRDGIAQCRPRLVFLENVEGIISSKTADGQSVLQYVLKELEGLGYRATAGVFSASEVGASHQRKRVFILAHAKELFSNGSGNYSRKRTQSKSSVKFGNSCWSKDMGHADLSSSKGRRISSGIHKEHTNIDGSSSKNSKFKKMANSKRGRRREKENARQQPSFKKPFISSSARKIDEFDKWPSRPDETPKQWEQPRVLFQTKNKINKVESQLGGATYGSANQVDRLRLLGNGVVPATAAKAFVTLANRFQGDENRQTDRRPL